MDQSLVYILRINGKKYFMYNFKNEQKSKTDKNSMDCIAVYIFHGFHMSNLIYESL